MRVSVTTCAAVAAVLAVSGCAGTRALGMGHSVQLSVSPSDGTEDVRPDSPITVTATSGRLKNVTVTSDGTRVQGTLSPDGTLWQSRWTLDPGQRYQVMATGLGVDGRTQTVTGGFTTRKVRDSQSIQATITAPDEGETVGVGMPIILHFESGIRDEAAVERALEVRSSVPVVGAWHWLDDQNVVFRTKNFWPAHTQVEFIGHLSGVPEAKDKFGKQDFDRHFTIGDSHITSASSSSHHETIRKNGKVIRVLPISMGRGGLRKYTTTSGIHLTMDKSYMTVMDSSTTGCGPGCPDYYRENVYWTVRISDTGEFEHSAPWSIGDQGHDNVSHGCINLSPSNAIWFYRFTNRGDIVKVTGTSRTLAPDNGWGYWQEDWPDWLRYSALQREITTSTPDGSAESASPAPAATADPSATPGA